MVIEAMADGGVKNGVPRALAYKMAAKSMEGSAKLVLETGNAPAVVSCHLFITFYVPYPLLILSALIIPLSSFRLMSSMTSNNAKTF